MRNRIFGGIIGLSIGDALGVPVEFKTRSTIAQNPVIGMRGFGTHGQPMGTWSDDSSLTFCLMESLCQESLDYSDISSRFIRWLNEAYWTPHGVVFDRGIATTEAIHRMMKGTNPIHCGGMDVYSNGNGSLMRILPLAFYQMRKSEMDAVSEIRNISSLTHGHFRSVFSCTIFITFIQLLTQEVEKIEAYHQMQKVINELVERESYNLEEVRLFDRILRTNIIDLTEDQISSSGYVLSTLEAAIWCFLSTDSFDDCVLKAVNLGDDSDTTGAVAGGLAGTYYGIEGVNEEWIDCLARKEDIFTLTERFTNKLLNNE